MSSESGIRIEEPVTESPAEAAVDVATRYVSEGHRIAPDLIAIRRDLHAHPEVGLQTARTQHKVLDALKGLDLEITTGKRLASVTAVLRGGKPGPTVLLRGDMDALPIVEETGLPYASTNGAMHACGHDLHTAGLVGAARILAADRENLPGNVIFAFQPGEEGDGGARIMIEEGLLDAAGERPSAAFAIHVANGPRGYFASRVGTMGAGSMRLEATIRGRGGHGSRPNEAVDPVPTAAEIVLALQTLATRRFDTFDPVVISVTQLATTEGPINAIPDAVAMGATVRALSTEAVSRLKEELPRIVRDVAAAHGAEAEINFYILYPPTINDELTTEHTLDALRGAFGSERVVAMPTPRMGSEDFSFMLEEVPGTFVGLLATPPDAPPDRRDETNHSPRVLFDDAVLGDQAAALAIMAHDALLR